MIIFIHIKNRWEKILGSSHKLQLHNPIQIPNHLQNKEEKVATDNQKCQKSNVNQNLKPYHTCILRKGVELDEKQSFIGCLADLYADYNDGIILTILLAYFFNINFEQFAY